MADDDNFDIDIYGDENADFVAEPQPQEEQRQEGTDYDTGMDGTNYGQQPNEPETEPPIDTQTQIKGDPDEMKYQNTAPPEQHQPQEEQQQIASTSGSSAGQLNVPKQAPTEQGTKRKEGEDDREVDPGATSALRLGELQWWMSEDDIRGWANQCGCEDELKDVTFNEHKVNGKSKGEAFVELASPQAATALKRRIDSFGADQQYVKKHTCIYSRPDFNPFKTSPKDAPQRNKVATAGAYNNGPGFQSGNGNAAGGGFRGGRGGYNRGGMNNMNTGMGMGGMGRGNFNNPQMNMMGGFNNGGMGGNFNNMMGGGFAGGMGGGFNNRGNMMGGGMRGGFQNNRGRGGMMMPNMGMGMGMGNMGGMGGMGAMGMGGMNMGGFGNNAQGGHFNPGFFGGAAGGNAAAGGGSMSPSGNPHGAKRPRPE